MRTGAAGRGIIPPGMWRTTRGNQAVALAAGRCVLLCTVALGGALHASSSPLARNPIVTAVHHQSCDAAVKLIKPDVRDNDALTAFLAGRMLDEGICVERDPQLAANFFARAAELGQRAAVLDYAAKVGLGVGTAQDYARAGELCRAGGVDSRKQLSAAALGYACTVAGVAGRLLRERLPAGAFTPVAGAAVKVEFTPGSGALQITGIPAVGRSDPTTGSYIRQPVIDANEEIDKAWREALQMVPVPAAARTETHAAALSIDVDMTLEQGHEKLPAGLQRLVPGEVHPTVTTQSH
jgi:hypothetical protein